MPDNSINNKRIAKNTLFLYLRMIIVMGIGLYTVRAILDLLGVVDYGIYNVVGGVVGMFQFLNGTLATSSQRYFSIEIAKGDGKRLNQWFCLNITTFSVFIILFIILAETIGLWFVNTQMTIPSERMFAANVVYQLSVISFGVSFFCVPYTALIIAYERMSAFAYISIVEAILKLGIVFVLSIITWDRLIIYGVLMFLTSCGITFSYILYNHRNFQASKYRPYWNKGEFKELVGFSGWHFLGTFSVVIRSQGINILLNLFFSPAVNAARAVAFQIYHAISQLSNNFFVAVKPQIYKNYATNELEKLYKLIIRSTAFCSLLISLLIYPILSNLSFVLSVWLKSVPEYATTFTQLVLINGLIDGTNGPASAAALATGKIRNYQIVISSLYILNLPVSFVYLKLGYDPTSTMIVSITISFFTAIVRGYFLQRMIGLPFEMFLKLFFKMTITSLLLLSASYFMIVNFICNFQNLVVSSILIDLLVLMLFTLIVFERKDVIYIINIIKEKCGNR